MTDPTPSARNDEAPVVVHRVVTVAVNAAWREAKSAIGKLAMLTIAALLGLIALAWRAIKEEAERIARDVSHSEVALRLAGDSAFQATIASHSGLPVGAVVAWPSNLQPPTGWRICDGDWLEANELDRIREVLKTIYGTSAELGRVRLPDFRGHFLRGFGGGSAAIGEPQADMVGPHFHSGPAYAGSGDTGNDSHSWSRYDGENGPAPPSGRHEFKTMPNSGTETRPVNHAVHWIIRVS